MDVSLSGTIDAETYLKKFRGASSLLAPPPESAYGRTISCFAYFLLSLLLIDLAFVVEFCVGLTQSCHATEGFGVVLLPLLRLLYGP